MRLINTQTLTLHDFTTSPKIPTLHDFTTSPKIPKYAILSHRWTDEELTYKEFSKHRSKDKKGYRKIVDFCEFLRKWEREWCWVDTVCIDKRSSAELSEAINSMFKWYGAAAECWVWLHDVSESNNEGAGEDLLHQFGESSWFRRGWTLQELLAPEQVIFCSHEWQILGCKQPSDAQKYGLTPSGKRDAGTELRDRIQEAACWSSDIILWAISDRTGIPSEVLRQPHRVKYYSVAQRMSWASSRQTTRVEDQAYCLLGLFRINMPLLYGEGRRAFQRLQQEIIRSSHDESIYAWTANNSEQDWAWLKDQSAFPILARSPQDFAGSRDIVRTLGVQRSPWTVTHHGLEVPLVPDNVTGTIELPGFNVTESNSALESMVVGTQDTVALSFPLACKRERGADSMPCKLVITRLRCSHWGRLITDNMIGHRPASWIPATIKFDRQKIYIHIDGCEDFDAMLWSDSTPRALERSGHTNSFKRVKLED
ncbi:hypothetical protein PRZ48_013937 [Zasmidium cellare]|uniref:Heterokaryon incompatibility domain-containing protein n=1 Tax=Zasmidium cellare TaxID=395010 RepID=A0ABR0DZI2_ZASCE|nr:hypothetical protein PRZ48_013937 [Zasmidium cellare]